MRGSPVGSCSLLIGLAGSSIDASRVRPSPRWPHARQASSDPSSSLAGDDADELGPATSSRIRKGAVGRANSASSEDLGLASAAKEAAGSHLRSNPVPWMRMVVPPLEDLLPGHRRRSQLGPSGRLAGRRAIRRIGRAGRISKGIGPTSGTCMKSFTGRHPPSSIPQARPRPSGGDGIVGDLIGTFLMTRGTRRQLGSGPIVDHISTHDSTASCSDDTTPRPTISIPLAGALQRGVSLPMMWIVRARRAPASLTSGRSGCPDEALRRRPHAQGDLEAARIVVVRRAGPRSCRSLRGCPGS